MNREVSLEKQSGKLRDFAKRIRDYFNGIGMNTSAEAAILKESVGDGVRYTEDIVKTFDRIAEQAVEHYQAQATVQKNTAQEGGVKYQARKGLSDSEIGKIQSIGRVSVNALTSRDIKATESLAKRYWTEMGVKSPFFRAWFGDWRINDATPIQIAEQRGNTRGVQRNEDTGWDINVSAQIFSETRNHKDSYNVAARPYLSYINDIVNKAILLDSYGVDPTKLKSHNSLLMHSLYAVADIGNGQEVLKLYVEEMNNPNADNTTNRSYQLQNIEKYHPAAKGSQKASPVSAASGTIKTIADLFAYVNQKDSSFIPNPVSKVVNADGTPKEMYHGTSNAGFSVFDTYGGKFGLFGKGSYFTDNPEVAESYTRKGKGQEPGVYGVYLNIRNPLDMDAKANLSAWKKAFKSADLDVSYLEGIATNEDAFRQLKENLSDEGYIRWEAEEIVTSIIEGMGYDGITHVGGGRFGSKDGPKHRVYIAFEPEQIKSSIENIGTFDGSNPDIRYQERTSTLTSRDILADALETVAQNEDERRALQKYRANIQKTVALEEEVTKSRSELRELRAKKGKTQAEKGRMEQLQNAIAEAEASIKRYDSALLKLEAAKPVKEVSSTNLPLRKRGLSKLWPTWSPEPSTPWAVSQSRQNPARFSS